MVVTMPTGVSYLVCSDPGLSLKAIFDIMRHLLFKQRVALCTFLIIALCVEDISVRPESYKIGGDDILLYPGL
jgi:hypothetical protein